MNAANEDLVSLFNDIFFKRVFIGHINIISDKYIIVYIFESNIMLTIYKSNDIIMLATSTDRKSNTYLSGKAKKKKTYKLRCKSTSSTHKNEVVGVSGKWTP